MAMRHQSPSSNCTAYPGTASNWRSSFSLRSYASDAPLLLRIYVVLLPVQIEISASIRFAPSDVVLCLYLLLNLGRLRINPRAWSMWHLALLLSMLISTAIGVAYIGRLTQHVYLNKLCGMLVLMITYSVFTSAIKTLTAVKSLCMLLIASVTVNNLLALACFFIAPLSRIMPLVNNSGLRLTGLYIDPNGFGGLIVMSLALLLSFPINKASRMTTSLEWFVLLSLTVGLLFTYSRSAWIGCSIVLFLLIFLRLRKFIALLSLSTVLTLSGLLFFNAKFIDHLILMASRPEQITGRIYLADKAITVFQSHPIFGIGLGSFAEDNINIVHNTFLWMLTELGLVGAFTISGFILWYFYIARLSYMRCSNKSDRSLILGLVSAHAGMIGVSMGIEALYQRSWWLCLALIACSSSAILARNQYRFHLLPYLRSQVDIRSA